MDPKPFLRGVAFEGTVKVPYPRANPQDASRLPLDTWWQAQVPVGVRIELIGDATEVRISYRAGMEEGSWRADAGTTFAAWRGGAEAGAARAVPGEGEVTLGIGSGDERVVMYLPEYMRPEVIGIEPVGGTVEPAPPQPRWVGYGDSILEGWVASAAALGWGSIAGREHGLDLINMGYAGAARGEIASAEQVGSLDADVITIGHGTNCWMRTPHTPAQMRENMRAFLDVVRDGHPETPLLVVSPIVRPDGEEKPNRLGATLADLRAAMEEAALERIEAGDSRLRLLQGLPLIDVPMLADGIHPSDAGHAALAAAIGPVIREMLEV